MYSQAGWLQKPSLLGPYARLCCWGETSGMRRWHPERFRAARPRAGPKLCLEGRTFVTFRVRVPTSCGFESGGATTVPMGRVA